MNSLRPDILNHGGEKRVHDAPLSIGQSSASVESVDGYQQGFDKVRGGLAGPFEQSCVASE